MKKRVFFVALMSLIMLIAPAHATARMIYAQPFISFKGNTATCNVTINVDSQKDKVVAEIELLQGNNFVASWKESSTGTLWFEETAQVVSGKTYTLKVTFTVNNGPQHSISTSGTCK